MKDEMDDRIDRLFAAARDEKVPVPDADGFFESRLLARIQELREVPVPWYAAAWRMLPAFAAVAAMVMICTFTFAAPKSNDIFAAITSGQEENAGISFLAGE